MPLPPAPKLEVSESDRKELIALSRLRSIPRGILLRVSIILSAAEGKANHLLARQLSTTITTVLLWRKRYQRDGLAGLFEDRPRSGRPKRISEYKEAAIVEATMKTIPRDATPWSVRTMAGAQKVSPATVLRIWRKHKLQPHRVESFKFSNDPDFAPEGARHRRALPESAGQSYRPERGREKPDSSAGPHTADSAAAARPARTANTRLQAPRHHDTVRGPERSGRNGDWRVPAAPPASGVSPVSGAD